MKKLNRSRAPCKGRKFAGWEGQGVVMGSSMLMKLISPLLMSTVFLCSPSAHAVLGVAQQPIVLWPKGAPASLDSEPQDIPTLTPYLPKKEKASGAAIIICPGGGYDRLSDREGAPVAEWLNSIGITAFVLKYRVAPRYHHPSSPTRCGASNSYCACARARVASRPRSNRASGFFRGRTSRLHGEHAFRCRESQCVRPD